MNSLSLGRNLVTIVSLIIDQANLHILWQFHKQPIFLMKKSPEKGNYLLLLLAFLITDATKRTNFNYRTCNEIYRYNYDISNATGSIESYATFVGSFDAYLSKRIRVHRRIRAVARTNTYPGLWSRFSRVIVRVRMRAKKRRGWKVITRRFDACLENSQGPAAVDVRLLNIERVM